MKARLAKKLATAPWNRIVPRWLRSFLGARLDERLSTAWRMHEKMRKKNRTV